MPLNFTHRAFKMQLQHWLCKKILPYARLYLLGSTFFSGRITVKLCYNKSACEQHRVLSFKRFSKQQESAWASPNKVNTTAVWGFYWVCTECRNNQSCEIRAESPCGSVIWLHSSSHLERTNWNARLNLRLIQLLRDVNIWFFKKNK